MLFIKLISSPIWIYRNATLYVHIYIFVSFILFQLKLSTFRIFRRILQIDIFNVINLKVIFSLSLKKSIFKMFVSKV